MLTNKVLIPVDGSQFSLQVLPYVARLLAPANNELLLLFVAPEPHKIELGEPDDPDLTIYADQEAASLESAFQAAMQRHVRALEQTGFRVTTVVGFGDPISEIENYIRDEHVDLV